MASSDFYPFPKLKEFMEGRKFVDGEKVVCIASGCSQAVTGVPRSRILLYRGIRALEKRWTKCNPIGGDYAESDKIYVHILLITVSGYELFERPSHVYCCVCVYFSHKSLSLSPPIPLRRLHFAILV